MKIIDLEQGSQTWLEWRKGGIGASDVAKVMKVHATESPLMLFNEICGLSKARFVSKAMQRGNDEEPKAIAWLEKLYGMKLNKVCAQDDSLPYLRCSFDAINIEAKILIEIKTPYNAEKLTKMIDGDIPIEYIYQVQYQMMIAGFDRGMIAVWDGQDAHCHIIEKDEKLHTKMIKEVSKFWNDLVIDKEPDLTNLDFKDKTEGNESYLQAAKELEDAMEMKRQAENIIKRLKPNLEEIAQGESIKLGNLKMKVCDGRDFYDTKAMKEAGIEVDLYKKTGSSYYRYSFG